MGKPRVRANALHAQNLRKFEDAWRGIPEDIKEILAAGLYVMTRKPGDILDSLRDARFALSPEKNELLKTLATYTAME